MYMPMQLYNEFKLSAYEMLKACRLITKLSTPDSYLTSKNLITEQAVIFKLQFVQSMSDLPYSAMPLDLWIEVTMNIFSKLKAGWLHLIQKD